MSYTGALCLEGSQEVESGVNSIGTGIMKVFDRSDRVLDQCFI